MAKLADLLAEQHSDPWMKDFLKASRPDQREAALALSEALTANVQGFPDKAKQKSRAAADGFAAQHNIPGRIRAQLEEIYAEQRRLKGQKCIDLADELHNHLAGTNYRWSKGQLALEDATCSNLKAQLDEIEKNIAMSRRIADEFHLPILKLRTLALDASFKRLQHRYEESWQELKEGLALYSQGVFPSERLYNFYSVMEQYLGDKRLPFAQRALLQQAILLRESDAPSDANILLTGGLYLRLANSFVAAGDRVRAEMETHKANALFDRAPDEPSVASYILATRIQFAEEQLRLGAPDLSIATLEPSFRLLPSVEHDFMFQDFNRVLGDSYRKAHRLDEAARAYESGIITAERLLSTVQKEGYREEWLVGTDPLYRGLVLNLLEQGRDEEALQLWEWFRARSSAERRPAPDRSWNEIKGDIFRPLPLRNETRLVYVALEDRLQIWIANNSGIQSKRVSVKQRDLEALVNDFAEECAQSDSDTQEVRKQSAQLGSLFLSEVAPLLKPSEDVLIELDPKIDKLPLVALIGPDGTYFDDHHAIIRTAGILSEREQRGFETITKEKTVLVADASPPAGPDFLPNHQDLADGISNIFPGTVIKQPAHARWAEVSREIGNREVFVFIGHGIRSGAATALVYGNLHLTAKDFPAERLRHLDLAVLIACSSGAGRETGPQGVDNLVQHFLAAGVPGVVGSRWDVDSRTTARLMEEFHRRLGSGQRPSLALSLARKQIRQEKPHPYYWAAFDLDARAN